jgi:hypothetical protein
MSPHRNPASGAAPAPAVRRRTEDRRHESRAVPSSARTADPAKPAALAASSGSARSGWSSPPIFLSLPDVGSRRGGRPHLCRHAPERPVRRQGRGDRPVPKSGRWPATQGEMSAVGWPRDAHFESMWSRPGSAAARPATVGNADYLVVDGDPASVAACRALSSRSGECKVPVPFGGMTHSRCPVSR